MTRTHTHEYRPQGLGLVNLKLRATQGILQLCSAINEANLLACTAADMCPRTVNESVVSDAVNASSQ